MKDREPLNRVLSHAEMVGLTLGSNVYPIWLGKAKRDRQKQRQQPVMRPPKPPGGGRAA